MAPTKSSSCQIWQLSQSFRLSSFEDDERRPVRGPSCARAPGEQPGGERVCRRERVGEGDEQEPGRCADARAGRSADGR